MTDPKRTAPKGGAKASPASTVLGTAVAALSSFEAGSIRLKSVVPLRDRCWVSVHEATQVAGEGRTKIYEMIAIGKLLTRKAGRRRLVNVASLLEYCGE